MEIVHGILEDIGAEIGYTATCSLVDWLGGRSLYVPPEPSADHMIATAIGIAAMRRLCAVFGGQTLNLPIDYQRELLRRDRMIAALLLAGESVRAVARHAMLTERQVHNIRRRLEEDGLLPLILRDVARKAG